MKSFAIAGLLLAASIGAAAAQPANPFAINEVRGGIMAHSWDEPGPNGDIPNLTRIQDANLEILFTPLPLRSWVPGLVRPNLGATINFGGLESMVYGGLSWKLPVFSTPLFVEAGFGASINNGKANGAVFPARDLGCATLFHEQLSLGYDITDNLDAMLTVEHSSSGGLCNPNRGLSNVGIRVGWKF